MVIAIVTVAEFVYNTDAIEMVNKGTAIRFPYGIFSKSKEDKRNYVTLPVESVKEIRLV